MLPIPAKFSIYFALAKNLNCLLINFILRMEDKITQNKDRENTVDTADFSINADENAAGTTHLNESVENESEVEKLE